MNTNIKDWDVEDPKFWESTGKSIAYRNLWISIPSLLLGFAIWLMWGIITVQMSNLGFPFSKDELFTLTAISGLAGATLRIPSSFFIRIAGGRNTIFLTTALLMIPAFGTGLALQSKETPLIVFQLLALLSGIGGGNFACSMSNISTFFPKRLQGTALGLNAGLGNFGVTTMQILIPLVMTAGLFGAMAGGSMELVKASGWILGKIPAGTQTFIQNAGFVWLLALIPLAVLGWFGMNNLLPITPGLGGSISAMIKVLWLYGLAFLTAGVGLYLYLPAPTGLGLLNMWVALPLIMLATLMVMKLAAFGEMKGNIAKQFAIFSNKHTWSMTVLYLLTFGSFIGFSISDKVGGSIVTQVISVVMVAASAYAGWIMMQAFQSATPEIFFTQFIVTFVVLFAATGIGNGSTFRTVGVIFDRVQAGPVLGWTSAVAAYGSFIAPVVIGGQIKAGSPENAMYGFAIFYALCLVLNWWFYLRKNSEIRNP
jgi:NNP family nitrate/nitrite transporter-like MFS transporter